MDDTAGRAGLVKQDPAPHFIRSWRNHRGLTLEQLAERIGKTHGAISQLERGETRYTQRMLEALAGALDCTPADLLTVDPHDTDGLWLAIEQATPAERRQIAEIARAIIKARL